MSLGSTLSKFFTYFSMTFKSNVVTTLLVITIIPLLLDWIKLTKIFDLIFLRSLLMLAICTFNYAFYIVHSHRNNDLFF